jgi:hypothetical protein
MYSLWKLLSMIRGGITIVQALQSFLMANMQILKYMKDIMGQIVVRIEKYDI